MSILIPLYKKGGEAGPHSYRPIALMSNGRKEVERALAREIKKVYEYYHSQLGFQEHTGVETSLIRTAGHHTAGLQYTAVLDLKGAYDAVPRDKVMQRVRKKLTPLLANMTALALQPATVTTRGDETHATAEISRGVTQGGRRALCYSTSIWIATRNICRVDAEKWRRKGSGQLGWPLICSQKMQNSRQRHPRHSRTCRRHPRNGLPRNNVRYSKVQCARRLRQASSTAFRTGRSVAATRRDILLSGRNTWIQHYPIRQSSTASKTG